MVEDRMKHIDSPGDAQMHAARQRIERLMTLCVELNQLLDKGMTLEVKIPEEQAIVVPGAKRIIHTIIISKPDVKLTLEPR